MSDETTFPVAQNPFKCPQCGHFCHPDATECPHCYADLTNQAPRTITVPFDSRLVEMPEKVSTAGFFDFKASLILQLVPSGVCITLPILRPILLGRNDPSSTQEIIDFTDFGAYQLGVSRRHCQLRRRGTELIITDLGSYNGTYLNQERLPPHIDRKVSHGDVLRLGKLAMTVLFSRAAD